MSPEDGHAGSNAASTCMIGTMSMISTMTAGFTDAMGNQRVCNPVTSPTGIAPARFPGRPSRFLMWRNTRCDGMAVLSDVEKEAW
jgi:hypothetical protein